MLKNKRNRIVFALALLAATCLLSACSAGDGNAASGGAPAASGGATSDWVVIKENTVNYKMDRQTVIERSFDGDSMTETKSVGPIDLHNEGFKGTVVGEREVVYFDRQRDLRSNEVVSSYDDEGRFFQRDTVNREFDEKGNLLYSENYSERASGETGIETRTYERWANGKKKYIEVSSSGDLLVYGSKEYYNEEGKLTHQEKTLLGTDEIYYVLDIDYDANGNKISQRCTDGEGRIAGPEKSWDKIYDEDGNCVECVYYLDENLVDERVAYGPYGRQTAGPLTCVTEGENVFVYDQDENLLFEDLKSDGLTWMWAYDAKGRLTEHFSLKSASDPHSRRVLQYDKHGNLTLEVESSKDCPVVEDYTFYTYMNLKTGEISTQDDGSIDFNWDPTIAKAWFLHGHKEDSERFREDPRSFAVGTWIGYGIFLFLDENGSAYSVYYGELKEGTWSLDGDRIVLNYDSGEPGSDSPGVIECNDFEFYSEAWTTFSFMYKPHSTVEMIAKVG